MAGWHHGLDGHDFELWGLVVDREAWHAAVHGVAESRTRLRDWTELTDLVIWLRQALVAVRVLL